MKRTTKAEWVAVLAVLARKDRPAYRQIRSDAWNQALADLSRIEEQKN